MATMTEPSQGFRTSPQQQRLWALEKRTGPVFRTGFVLRLANDLDRERLGAALLRVANGWEILRTRFEPVPGLAFPLQIVAAKALPDLQREDLTGWSPERQRRRVTEILTEAELPDDAPPWIAILLMLSPREHLLVLVARALSLDRPSIPFLVERLKDAYLAFPGPEEQGESLQYPEIAEWQHEMLAIEEGDGPRFWRGLDLSHLLSQVLPYERSGAGGLRFTPLTVELPLAPALDARLRQLASRAGSSLEALLLAGWQILLGRLLERAEEEGELVVGVAVDGRNYEELRGSIGPLARYVPVPAPFHRELSFEVLVRRVEGTLQSARLYQEYFAWPAPSEADALSFFPLTFELYDRAGPTTAGPISISLDRELAWGERFGLHVAFRCHQGRLAALELGFDAERFEATDARRLAGQLATLLASAAEQPAGRAADMEVVAADERDQLLHLWNATRVDYARLCLHELVTVEAGRHPEAVAVVSEGRALTWGLLVKEANRLALALSGLGVGPGQRVAVAMVRSLDLVVAILGTLAAGAAYLPLDPTHPREHLELLLEDARPAVLLTQREIAESLLPYSGPVLTLDSSSGVEARPVPSSGRGAGAVSTADLAYVLYTSGSTGRPKAVMISHGAIVNRLLWMEDAFHLTTADRVLQKTPFTFDASVWELFSPLLSGACLVLARPDGHRDVAYLAAEIAASGITVLQLVPSLLGVFLEAQNLAECRSLRRIFCGGEGLPAALAARCRAALPAAALINLYGPTETAIDATFHLYEDGTTAAIVPIGRPLSNVQTHVLSPAGRLMPSGFMGELQVGGAGLAQGYLGRPDLTAERFVPDPFGAAGARLYRTGDLARRRPSDGILEYLGRIDQQVKVRGVRIELGGVEAALCRHPGVIAAAATVEERPGGERRLIAYYVAAEPPAPLEPITPAELRSSLLARLPEAWVPSALFRLEEMPRNRNGKLDRRALPSPDELSLKSALGPAPVSRSPETPVESVLAAIWGHLLGSERVGMDDDFFASGGHSLLVMQLIGRVREAFGVDLTLRSIFERPTLADLAAAVEDARRGREGAAAPDLVRVPRGTGLPLSFAQQRLWFLDRLVPESAFYNIPLALEVSAPLDIAALEWSFRMLIERHESLRTRFAATAGEPQQIVLAVPTAVPAFLLPRIDLARLPAEAQGAESRRLAAGHAGRPFDLSQAPLLRVAVLRLGERMHRVLVTVHHIVADAWSMEILVREMTELLAAAADRRPKTLPELPFQYVDFASWQRRFLVGEVLAEQLAYWRGQLAGAPAVLDLPTDRARPAIQTFTGSLLYGHIPADTAAVLRRIARGQGVTDFMLLLAAFAVLLHRYTGQPDVVVGTPIANRARPELQDIVGFFLNTLALRVDLHGDLTASELLARVREVAIGAYIHQDVPFEKLVLELQPERNLSHQPIFQVMFNHEHAARRAGSSPFAAARSMEAATDSAKFDLVLGLEEEGGGLIDSLEYNTDLFDRSTAGRLLEHFARLLAALAREPEARVATLPFLTAAEAHQLILGWNDTARLVAGGPAIHSLFEAQAERTPEAVAVLWEGRELRYRELDRWANRLAHHLRDLGLGAGDRVGVFLDRSLEMIPTLLAILKAGAAYLPVETGLPEERVTWLLAGQRVRCVLTQTRHAGALQALDLPDLAHLVCLDDDAGEPVRGAGRTVWTARDLQHLSAEPPGVAVAAEDIAYVIFTSGSTGVPKGVVVQHGPVLNLIDWVNRTHRIGPSDRVLFVTSLSFDLSVYDIFGLLAAGGSIEIATEDDLRQPERLLAKLARPSATVWDSAPAALDLLAPLLSPRYGDGGASRLRLVLLSGDWIPVGLPDRVRSFFPQAQVVSLGGATEATVWSNFFPVGRVDPRWRSIPYGRPIQNARYLVLDAELSPCPIGVRGDLYIGGPCLASGYSAQPGITAERFVPDPFPGVAGARLYGARLYRTGDRVRFGADGTLEFMGRLDHQVKIRGFRIELGEIEATLTRHPAVGVAVATAQEEARGDKTLVVYVVPRAGEVLAKADLHQFLADRLPVYMVPAAFVFLDRLPVTANGKLDRRALPCPFTADRETVTAPPRDPSELQMLLIWEEVLGVSGLGVNDNFFDLGGHSVLAVRLMALIEQRSGRDLPIATLFGAPTVREMVAVLRDADGTRGSLSSSVLVPIQPQGERTPLFLVHPIGGHVLCYVQLARHLGRERPVLGLESAGRRPGQPLATSVEAMASHYVEEMQRVQPEGPYVLGGMSSGGVIAFEMAQQLRGRGQEVALLLLLDSRPPAFTERLEELLEDAALFAGWARELELSSGRNLGISYEALRSLTADEQLTLLLGRLQETGLLPPEVAIDRARHLVHLLKTNLRAVEAYVPRLYPGKITLFRATENDVSKLAESEWTRRILAEVARHPSYGWSRLASEPVEVCPVPGEHLTLAQEPNVVHLAAELRVRLDTLEREGESPELTGLFGEGREMEMAGTRRGFEEEQV
jgi:amino acid adenylation domain-containing protein